ncbi:MinD/ParA family protein [Pseudonocardia ailaonensis]|uniref:MinD/ParA family protein n=1 Tax=Pseudonocardia ailaonensis TaxID=367279 RepID=A0ABN2NHM8_9PSEU
MSETGPDEYPDGSVGRYVRERWAAAAQPSRERREEPTEQPPQAPEQPGIGARRDETWGVVPEDRGWGSDLLELEGELDDPFEERGGRHPEVPAQAEPPADQSWFDGGPPVTPPPAPGPEAAPPAEPAPQQGPVPNGAPRPTNGVNGHQNGAPTQDAPGQWRSTDPAPAPAPRPEPWNRPEPRRTRVDQPDPPRHPEPARDDVATPPSGAHARPPMRDVGRWTDPGAVAAQEAQRARSDEREAPADLSTARLLKPSKRRTPRTGWRRFLYLLSGRTINPGESPQDIHERELTVRVNQALIGCHKIATLSLKGGVGKTTITATLGATFASLRGDRVVAVDANPDRGTLSQKVPLETSATVRHLLRDSQRVRRYTDVRAYTSQAPSRLEVLASEQDPAVSEAFSEDDYRRTVTLLEHFYNIVLTDCGTGLMHSAMYGVLGVADQLIIVSSGSIDGARSASATMDWLEAHERGDLVRNAVVVINSVHRQAGAVDLDRVEQHFAGRCRAVIRIPFDAHLEEGAEVDLDRLTQPTRIALLELAASVADGFPS